MGGGGGGGGGVLFGPVLLAVFVVYCLNLPIYSFTFRLYAKAPLPMTRKMEKM